MADDRRRYTRVAFHAPARLVLPLDALDAVVIDLSLKGALIRLPAKTVIVEGESGNLHVRLGETDDRISMAVKVAHVEGRYAGVVCEGIDLDSVTHLRRLAELNLGDSDLLDRELSSFIVELDVEEAGAESVEDGKNS